MNTIIAFTQQKPLATDGLRQTIEEYMNDGITMTKAIQ